MTILQLLSQRITAVPAITLYYLVAASFNNGADAQLDNLLHSLRDNGKL